MSNKNNKKKKSKNSFSSKYEVDTKKEDRYDNPVKSKAGKIIIVTIAFFMIAGSIFALIWAIINSILH